MSLKIDTSSFDKDILKIMRGFDKKQKKAILRTASTPLVKSMKGGSEWSDKTGEFRSHIKARTWAKSESYFVSSFIDGSTSKRKRTRLGKIVNQGKFDPYYFKWVEYGAYNVWAKRKLPARNALSKAIQRATDAVVDKIKQGVQRILNK